MKARIRKLPAEKIAGDCEEQANSLWPKSLPMLDSKCWDRKNEGCAKLQMGDRKSYGEISLSMDTGRSRAHNLRELKPIPLGNTPWLLGGRKI